MRLSQRSAWLLLLFALPSIAGCSRSQPAAPDRIVFVVVDTLRRDHVSSFGGQVPTPHIDRLAERGQVFDDAVSSFHMTSMSMGALFTGHTPSLETGRPEKTLGWNGRVWCGLARFASTAANCVPAELPTIGEAMQEAGYQTLGVVSNRLLFDPAGFSQGFDEWHELGSSRRPTLRLSHAEKKKLAAARSGAAVNRAVEGVLSRRSSDRFFLYVHYMDAHDYLFDYPDAVGRADAAVGGLVAILEAEALLDGAALVFTSDHGELLGEDQHPVHPKFSHGGNPSYENVVRVPLIVSPPLAALGVPEPRHPLRGQDVFGLLLRIAGLEPPDPAGIDRDELFLSERRWQTYRKGDWKLIRERKGSRAMLFDLAADPDERNDVTEAHPERAADFSRRLDQITTRLAPQAVRPTELTEEDRARLRALGYAE